MQVHGTEQYSDCYSLSIAFAPIAPATLPAMPMQLDELTEWRRQRLEALAKAKGGNAPLGRLLGYKDGAFVGQMVKGIRPITEKTIERAESLEGCAGWFDRPAGARIVLPVDMDNHPDLTRIRSVRLKLTAGISGYAVEPEDAEGLPIFFRSDWMSQRGFKPYELLAIRIKGRSMEPSLHEGDMVVINTADTTPKDGEVYAVNYEGEPVVKRLVRDAGAWWLASDNPDQRQYPRKQWIDKSSHLVGRVVHKQSERI